MVKYTVFLSNTDPGEDDSSARPNKNANANNGSKSRAKGNGNPRTNKSKNKIRYEQKQNSGFKDQSNGIQKSSVSGGIPTEFNDQGTVQLAGNINQLKTKNGSLIPRVSYESVKFSPIGEEGSLVRKEFLEMIRQWRAVLKAKNLQMQMKQDPLLSITELEEYFCMISDLIITFEFLVNLDLISKKPEYSNNNLYLINYANNVLSRYRGLGRLISSLNSQIQRLYIPDQLLVVIRENFGIFLCEDSGNQPRILIRGAQIPINFGSYKIVPLRTGHTIHDSNNSVFEAFSGKKRVSVEGEPFPGVGRGYSNSSVMQVPPVSERDHAGIKALLYNFEVWSTISGGTYEKLSTLFSSVCGRWKQDTYQCKLETLKRATQSQRIHFDNFPLCYPNNGMTEMGVVQCTDVRSDDEAISFFKKPEESYIMFHQMFSWSTIPRNRFDYVEEMSLVNPEDVGYREDEILEPRADKNGKIPEAYPGMFIRLLNIEDIGKDTRLKSPRYILNRSGQLSRLTELEDIVQLHFRHHVDSDLPDRKTQVCYQEESEYYVSSDQITNRMRDFICWMYSNNDIIQSPLWGSDVKL